MFVVLICVSVAGFLLQPQLLPKLWEQTKPHWTMVVTQNRPFMPYKAVTSTLVLLDTNQRLFFPQNLSICYVS